MPEEKFFGIYRGTVVNVDDPIKANRVQVRIPGICEPHSVWASPKGLFTIAKNFGLFSIPMKNTEVLVQFEAGDINSPYYEIGSPAPGEIPEELQNRTDKFGISIGDMRLVFTTKPNGTSCRIYSSKAEENNYIELDSETNSIEINSLTLLKLNSTGLVEITGGHLSLQGRPVLPEGKEI